MKNTIFVLDDRNERLQTFRDIGLDIKNSVSIYRSFTSAKNNFLRADPRVLFLEYGLSIQESKIDENKDGLDFALWLSLNDGSLSQRKVVIHTIDSAKARAMKRIIPNAHILPFNKFSKDRSTLYTLGILSK